MSEQDRINNENTRIQQRIDIMKLAVTVCGGMGTHLRAYKEMIKVIYKEKD